MSYLRPPMRAYPTRFRRGLSGNVIVDRDPNRSRPTSLSGACCASCARGGPCAGGQSGMSGLGDDASTPQTLDQRVAAIQSSAAQYVAQDAFYKKLQIAAVLLIPLASLITKTILHVRRGDPIL